MCYAFTKQTNNIVITVTPTYLDDQSDLLEDHYVWAYTVLVENKSDKTVQLLGRHWQVTDALGQVQHVRGSGVVGEQPVINAGQAFQYTSGTVLPTPSGFMVGEYEMVEKETGEIFWVDIPAFSLDSPEQTKRPN